MIVELRMGMGRRGCHAPEQSRDEEGLASVISIFHPRLRRCDLSRQMRSAGTRDGRGTHGPGTHRFGAWGWST